MVFTDSDEDDDDDLGRCKHRSPPSPNTRTKSTLTHRTSSRTSSSDSTPVPQPRGHGPSTGKKNDFGASGTKVAWSSDEDGENIYQRLQDTKRLARSTAIKLAHKARVTDRENNPRPSAAGSTGVGKRPGKRKRGKERNNGNPTDDESDLMEWIVPEYLQERRARFNQRRNELKDGGLELPPAFDEMDFSDDERLHDLKERPHFPHLKPCAPYKDIELPYSLGLIPAPIAQYLRVYQVKGVAFLHEQFVYQKGAILGDDMGLGKTIQVIAFLTVAYGKTGDERDHKRMKKMTRSGKKYFKTLLICPGSLIQNWVDELRRWGWWHAHVYHGPKGQREEVLGMAHHGHLEIMITTYDTYRRNCEHAGDINLVKWDCIIADECHKIKERKASITQEINNVNAMCRIGLTGTAIQNKYEELWTLLNWTNPGVLGPISTWRASICLPLKMGQSHNASNYELARARKTAKSLAQNLLPRFFLRRTKALIQDQLRKKSDRVVFCPLTDIQADAYQRFLDSDIVQKIRNSGLQCHCRSGKKQGWCHEMETEDGRPWQHWVFPAIATLQKLSNHLAILIPSGNDAKDKQAKDLDLLQIVLPDEWKELFKSKDSMLHTGNPEYCGKWKVLRKLLKFWYDQGSNKVLVFSHSVRLLRMLQNLFISTSYNVTYLDGSMSYEDRYAAVQEFNTDPTQFVFLISTRAGGVGLNITSANKVVVVDPNWNPAYDLQAQDRAYRIGQTRDVEVFRLVSRGTLEEVVYARQIYKQQQASIGYNASSERRYFQGVQDRPDQQGEIFGLINLFTFQDDNVVLRDIVNKTNVAESKVGFHVTELDLGSQTESQNQANDEDHPTIKADPEAEDAMMSQLAAEIAGDTNEKGRHRKNHTSSFTSMPESTKRDPIAAILSSVGVDYTHENSEVIGTSRVEAHLSKQAEAAAEAQRESWDTERQLARVFIPDSQSQIIDVYSHTSDLDGGVPCRYRPPEEVKKRQFGEMAKWAGYGDVVEFALVVEGWTQERRRECLERFYRWRRDVLDGFVKDEELKEESVQDESEDDEL